MERKNSIPSPRNAPTFPRICSAHLCASSFFCISLTAACAWLTAAVAVDNIPPHQPPLFCGAGTGALSTSSGDSVDVVAGVNAACVPDLVLSPDLRCPPLFDFSSLERPGGGVAVDVRVGERAADLTVLGFKDGVAGLLAGLCARFPSSASSSCSDWLDVLGLDIRDALVLGRVCA